MKGLVAVLLFAMCGVSPAAHAEFELRWGGKVQSDLRFRIEKKSQGTDYHRLELPTGISRNENLLKLKVDAFSGDFAGVAELDFVFMGFPEQVNSLSELSERRSLDPYRIEAHALYVEALDFIFEGLHLRVGMQKLLWGVGDQFNPTNTLNANDVEDELLFGDQQANAMIRLDWTPFDWLRFTGALIPIFRPALLPLSGELGIAAVERLPFVDGPVRQRIAAEQGFSTQLGYPTIVSNAQVELPGISFENMQVAFQVGFTLAEQDIALSYYYGRTDIPQASANHTVQVDGPFCPLGSEGEDPDTLDCMQGFLTTEVTLKYPRMQVVGLNMAGELPAALPIGYRLEVGLYIPERQTVKLTQDDLLLVLPSGIPIPYAAGEYNYGPAGLPESVSDTPFAKWSFGLDYTFNEHFYMNVQWVHGLVDEYGAGDWISEGDAVRDSGVTSKTTCEPDDPDCVVTTTCVLPDPDGTKCAYEILKPRLADYLVVGMDIKFLNDAALIRLFTLFDLNGVIEERWDAASEQRVQTSHSFFTEEGFSAVIYPSFSYFFGGGFSLSAGALLKFGKPYTKFGDPAAGGSVIWTSGRFSF